MEELFIFYIILVAVVGLCVGSFLNVVIYRVPNQMSLSAPSSHCPSCNTPIKWFDNIPVLSFLLLKGKCRSCKKKISLRYMAIELLNALLWVAAFLLFGKTNLLYALLSLPLISVLICVAFIDLDCKIIPDRFHIILFVIAVAACFLDGSVSLIDRGLTLLGTATLLLLIWAAFKVLAKKDAIGFGDIKLLVACAPFFGFAKMFLAMLISSVLGSIILVALTIKNKENKNKEFPFAPFLAVGLVIALLAGNEILNAYYALLNLI